MERIKPGEGLFRQVSLGRGRASYPYQPTVDTFPLKVYHEIVHVLSLSGKVLPVLEGIIFMSYGGGTLYPFLLLEKLFKEFLSLTLVPVSCFQEPALIQLESRMTSFQQGMILSKHVK